jgi:hypothetical protein
MRWRAAAIGVTALGAGLAGAQDRGPTDADTRAWWAATAELSGDAMDGRDIGSPGYDRAAALVAKRFAAAGLKPAGEGEGWFQPIAFDDVAIDDAHTRITINGQPLAMNSEVTLVPLAEGPTGLDVPATFRGYCGPGDIADVTGKMVLCYGRPAPARLGRFDRAAAIKAAGAVGMLTIAAPGLASEPIRWPFAYSRTVRFAGEAARPVRIPEDRPVLNGQLNPAVLARLMPGADVLSAGAAGRDLAPRDLGRFIADLAITHRAIRSANVLGLLPGADPALANEVVVVSAHLDGYGHGTPIGGDAIYNGALDDAAYVALLERMAANRHGRGFRRPVLFAVFTGEEKGLLGSTWFTQHPTLPKRSLVADINLDQLRPLYPLKRLTVHGLSDSDLGDTVRRVATARGIGVQEDPEPERQLLRRSDNWPFARIGVPGTSFVFATYDDASRARYRDWYERRYHHPADDLSTPIDWTGARDFNAFFYALTEAVANGPRPAWAPGRAPAG